MPKSTKVETRNEVIWQASAVVLDVPGGYRAWFDRYVTCEDKALYAEIDERLEGTLGINGLYLDTYDRVRNYAYLVLLYACDAITALEESGVAYMPATRRDILRQKGNRSNEKPNVEEQNA